MGQKFYEIETTGNIVSREQHRGVLPSQKIAAVRDTIAEDTELSIRLHLHYLGLSYGSFGAFCIQSCIYTREKFK